MRPEPGNKITVLGFFGLLPKVTVILTPEEQSVKLVFMLMISKGSGEYALTPRIITPSNSVLVDGQPTLIKLHPGADGTGTGFGFIGLQFNEQGTYTFQLAAQGQVVYRSSFKILRGIIPTFK